MIPWRWTGFPIPFFILLGTLVGGRLDASQKSPTYTRDVAPILFANCVTCHRPGQLAPFSLLTYQDARRRNREIVQVTESRFMPPWKPEPGHGEFLDERRLIDQEISTLRRWMEAGAPEGDPAHLPPTPEFAPGWQLGEPDLIVTMPRTYRVTADGTDVFRNFVLPVDLAEDRYVRAIELRAENPRLIHHATVLVDPSGTARDLDSQDPEEGFAGMLWSGEINPPDGQFLGWTPGRLPRPLPEGTWWRLAKGADLVLECHLLPTGKPESFRASVGLYFSSQPPTHNPVVLRLGSEALDIPAGEKAYSVEDAFVLPVDARAVMLYPHAHYLGREIEAWATLPDGSQKPLIRISDWDFNWQDSYDYKTPLLLRAGSKIEARFVYDNSEDNLANPHHPPQQVRFGAKSSDEMGDLWIQLVAQRPAEREELYRTAQRHRAEIVIAGQQMKLRHDPRDASALTVLADLLARLGRVGEAVSHYQEAVRLQPESVPAHNNLAAVLVRLGRSDEAVDHYREALRLGPGSAQVRVNLASALAAGGQLVEAEDLLRQALGLDPDHAGAHLNLGSALTDGGRPAEGMGHLLQALDLGTEDRAIAYYNLGNALARLGRGEEATAHYREALRLDPDYASAHNNLGTLLGGQGRLEAAARHFRQALRISPDHRDAHNNLGALLEHWGQVEEALEHFEAALIIPPVLPFVELVHRGDTDFRQGRLAQSVAHLAAAVGQRPDHAESWRKLAQAWHRLGRGEKAIEPYRRLLKLRPGDGQARQGLAWILATHPQAHYRNGQEAVDLVSAWAGSADAAALDVVAAAYAEAGRFEDAVRIAQRALSFIRSHGGQEGLAGKVARRLELYQARRPYREVPR